MEYEKNSPHEDVITLDLADDTLGIGLIAVPIDRYTELIKKEVELDLIYAKSETAVYGIDEFVKSLHALRTCKGQP